MPYFKFRKKKYYISKTRVTILSLAVFCIFFVLGAGIIACAQIGVFSKVYSKIYSIGITATKDAEKIASSTPIQPPPPPTLDKADYDARMIALANYPVHHVATSTASSSKVASSTSSSTMRLHAHPPIRLSTSTLSSATTSSSTASTTIKRRPWPAQTVYPNYGALLPFNRIVAYYGNFYSTAMGILGQYPTDVVLQKLQGEVAAWAAADPTTPVIPAIDYIAVTAQGSAGADGDYRLRMPDDQIQKAIDLANQVNGVVFLDVQPGLSTFETEIPLLEKYLKMPNVELAMDPEFSMHNGKRPGSVIGTTDAADINWAANYLANLVKENNLPPKIIVIHRFTENMVTNYQSITPLPEVQIVMNMDGWSTPSKKERTYAQIITPEPVQFAGIKLFYKNDLAAPDDRLMTTSEVLGLQPRPIYIQYQ